MCSSSASNGYQSERGQRPVRKFLKGRKSKYWGNIGMHTLSTCHFFKTFLSEYFSFFFPFFTLWACSLKFSPVDPPVGAHFARKPAKVLAWRARDVLTWLCLLWKKSGNQTSLYRRKQTYFVSVIRRFQDIAVNKGSCYCGMRLKNDRWSVDTRVEQFYGGHSESY